MQRNGTAPVSTNGTLLSEPLPPPSATMTLLDADTPAQAAPAAPQPVPTHKLSASTGASIDAQLLAARVALDTVLADPAMQDSLALYGYDAERLRAGRALYERALALHQAQRFYANALGDSAIGQKLAAFGATQSQLIDAQQLVAAVASKLIAQHSTKETALALTRQRDAALAAMGAWMRDFRAIARVALGGQ